MDVTIELRSHLNELNVNRIPSTYTFLDDLTIDGHSFALGRNGFDTIEMGTSYSQRLTTF